MNITLDMTSHDFYCRKAVNELKAQEQKLQSTILQGKLGARKDKVADIPDMQQEGRKSASEALKQRTLLKP
jgi:hypothetical protein